MGVMCVSACVWAKLSVHGYRYEQPTKDREKKVQSRVRLSFVEAL